MHYIFKKQCKEGVEGMSKKKDRVDTTFRSCPICRGKQIIVYSRKLFKEKLHIYCYKCHKDIAVKIISRKENLDYIEMEKLLKRR